MIRLRWRIAIALVGLVVAACKGGAAPPREPSVPAAATDAPDAGAAVVSAPVNPDPFAALMDERAGVLIAASKVAGTRGAVMMRVIWQTVAAEPVSRIETMAFLLPDGRLRWGVLGIEREPAAVETSVNLMYPDGVLGEGVRRPLAAAQGDCKLPIIELADVATMPARVRDDTFEGGYRLADACRIGGGAAGAAWVVSIDWFGAFVQVGAEVRFVSTVPHVDGARLELGPPQVTSMDVGGRDLVDASGAPMCTTGERCFAIGERAVLTGERPLAQRAYDRACELGRGLGCIHLAALAGDDATAADGFRTRAVTAFRAACDAKDALECAYLGIALETGQGVAKDEAAAVGIYTRACDGGAPLGCFNLGGLYREGRGVRRDAKRSKKAYQRACDLGDAGGCDAATSP